MTACSFLGELFR